MVVCLQWCASYRPSPRTINKRGLVMAAIVCLSNYSKTRYCFSWLNLLQVPAKLSLWVVRYSDNRLRFYARFSELVFAIFKYQSRSVMVAMFGRFCTAIAAFPIDYFYGYLNEVAVGT